MGAEAPAQGSKSAAQPKLNHNVKNIGKYQVLPAMLGDGSFSSVYPCQYPSSTSGAVKVAVKLSTCPVSDCHYDDKWECHRKEWQTYQDLSFGRTAEGQEAGIPAVYECGLVKTESGIHTWISMQLLGTDLRTLASKHIIELSSDFMRYASGMLAALEHMHSHGIVHRDIKPANFCLGDDTRSDKVYIVDFGFASSVPSAGSVALDQVAFKGTIDYASRDTLRGNRCSPKDDLESLGYCFLEMLLGDLPWYLTLYQTDKGTWQTKSFGAKDFYSQEQLCSMAEEREVTWKEFCSQDLIPPFLISWLEYVHSLGMYDTPCYALLKRILQRSQDPTSYACWLRLLEHRKRSASATNKRSRSDVAEHNTVDKKQKVEVHVPEE